MFFVFAELDEQLWERQQFFAGDGVLLRQRGNASSQSA
jgi:hypothetical protein